MNRLARRTVVLGALVLAGAVLLLSAAPWVTATTSSPVAATVPLSVSGHDASPLVTAGALVVAAAALALSLGGRIASRVAGAAVALGGALVAWAPASVVLDPSSRAEAAARADVGVATLTDGPHVGVAAPVALVLGVVLVLVGVAAIAVAGRWSASDTRHRLPRTSGEARANAAGQVREGPPADASPVPGDPLDDRDAWDALSRGEDPT